MIEPVRLIKSLQEEYGDRLIASTSFGTTSAILLHHLYLNKLNIKILWVNTGFLPEETIEYARLLSDLLSLEIIELNATGEHSILDIASPNKEEFDQCCSNNKVLPFENYLAENNIKAWISGAMHFQTKNRKTFQQIMNSKGLIKAYPFLGWDEKMVRKYYDDYKLPMHPLQTEGYESIGCAPCSLAGSGREGRWAGMDKHECGLHTEIFNSTLRPEDK